jgi:hypothetical protein
MRVVINGMACELGDGATVGQLRAEKNVGRDQVVRQEGATSQVLKDDQPLRDGDRIYSIPKIVKGCDKRRLETELSLLRQAAGARSEVIAGSKTIGEAKYTAVLVKNVRVPREKFGVTCTDLLFLLPPWYPSLPPVGCYLNYRWRTADEHFLLQGVHGAQSLVDQGWYWYCVALGGGFDGGSVSRVWQPGTRADNGHNLVTLFAAARHAINTN